jgi:hypothetical protein
MKKPYVRKVAFHKQWAAGDPQLCSINITNGSRVPHIASAYFPFEDGAKQQNYHVDALICNGVKRRSQVALRACSRSFNLRTRRQICVVLALR